MDLPPWRRRSAHRQQRQRRPSRTASRARRRGAGRSAASPAVEDGRYQHPSPRLWLWNVRGWGQSAGLDLSLDLVQLGFKLGGRVEVVDRVPGALIRDAESERTALELTIDDILDRGIGRHVNFLERAGDNGRVGVLLVCVHADAVDAGLAGGLQRAQPAAARDLEDDVSALPDLGLSLTLALGRVGEVVRVTDEDVDRRVFHLRRPLVARDVVVDRGDADAADRADHVLVLLGLAVLFEPSGDHAYHGTCVLLFEEEGLDVAVLQVDALGVGAGAVDDGEMDVWKRA